MSLTTYVAEDAAQNKVSANRLLAIASGLRNSREKIKGARTNAFFIHCLGRMSWTSPLACAAMDAPFIPPPPDWMEIN